MSENNEIWKPVVGYEDYYEISSMGRVRSLDRYARGSCDSIKLHKGRILNPKIDRDGYCIYNLCKDGQSKSFRGHRLVADAFIPNPDNKPCIDHINCVRSDNRLENLRWVTHKENNNNPITTNRMSTAKKNQEKGNHQTPIIQYDLNGNFIKQYPTIKEAVMETGTNRTSIISCASGRYKTANGFRWGYIEKKGAA